MPISSITAKILLISLIPTASSMRLLSGARAEVGGRSLSPGDDDRGARPHIEGGQRRHRVLLVGNAPLVVAGNEERAAQIGDEQLALGNPPLAGRRWKRQGRRLLERLLADLLERRGRVELLHRALSRPSHLERRDDLGIRGL